jgi:hypothetical protein
MPRHALSVRWPRRRVNRPITPSDKSDVTAGHGAPEAHVVRSGVSAAIKALERELAVPEALVWRF